MAKKPHVERISAEELQALLAELQACLPAALYQKVEGLLRTLQWLMGVIESKRASIGRLRRMLFGPKTEKTGRLLPDSNSDPKGGRAKSKGHGRNAAQDYPGARRVAVAHPEFRAGCSCPLCQKGKLYLYRSPVLLVAIEAQPTFQATCFELEQFRCSLCGGLLTAPTPPQALQKYHPSVGTMLGILRYGAGLPMYRIAKWQACLGAPLAESTQWELIAQAAEAPAAVYQALIDAAAQGRLLQNDDTTMRVQSLKPIRASTKGSGSRTGVFTTSILSQLGDHQAALFFTGSKHAGENLDDVLKRRAADLEKPLQMCDGLSRNVPKEFQTILCNCIPHARRNFVEVMESCPEACAKVLESLRQVFAFEAQAKEDKLDPARRLAFHQEHSRPVMEELHRWTKEQLDQKKVEPNSGLGKAIVYMHRHWEKLTRFLTTPGAPLDNNGCERALKLAILHRKNSLSYKTPRGAQVGDIFMSLIQSCQLNRVNPFDYLMALQRHENDVRREPSHWLPWNYQQAAARLDTG